jgi:hypothetical protein
MTQIHKLLGRRVLPNEASVARVIRAAPDKTNQNSTAEGTNQTRGVRRSGDSSSTGQTNQNSTAQGTNQTIGVGQVGQANAGTSTSP